jgi:hypothetical protein
MKTNILMPIMIFMTRSSHSFFPPYRSFSDIFFKNFTPAILAGVMFFAYSCEEDPSKIGRKILPPSDFVTIISTDTLDVKSFTMYSDSVESDNPSTSYLGELYDPYFGTTTAEFVSQIRLGSAWNSKYSYTVDSVKLYLQLLTVSGAVDKPHYLALSEIARQIYTDSTYYSSQNVPLTGFKIDNILLPKLKADTINDIEIDIDTTFAKYIIRDTSKLFHHATDPDFRSYFKGLLFQVTSPGNPIFVSLSIDPPGTYGTYTNYFVLYMHDTYFSKKEFYLIIDAVSRNAAFNLFRHDFTTAEPDKRINHINDNYPDTMSYVQMMNGLYTKILIPGLSDLRNNPAMKGISVNKARLIFPVVYDNKVYKPSTIPSQLFLRYVNSSGERTIIPDYNPNYPLFYDGTPDTTKDIYNLNLATYVQGYLEDTSGELTTELELFLLPASSNNVILKANGSHPPVKFEFTYTRF